LDTFEIAPRLRSLTLGPDVSLTWLRIPWSQLTHCDIFTCQMTINGCFEVLDNSPNLVECTLALHYQGAVAHQPRPLIQHEHLCALSISIRKNLDIGPLLDNLTLPALQAFSIHCDNATPWVHSQFLSLLSRSACLLLKLCLHFDFKQFTDDELILYLLYVNWSYGGNVLAQLSRVHFWFDSLAMCQRMTRMTACCQICEFSDSTSIPGRSVKSLPI
jgi:hypothetical protein